MGYHYFWAMFWDQKVSASYIELTVGSDLNQILTLKFGFNNLCSIIIYMFAQG